MDITKIAKKLFQNDREAYGSFEKLSWDRLPKDIKNYYKRCARKRIDISDDCGNIIV